ncbi:hypothetical protein HanXRQr2_Chr17g0806861 [Helianthus annuus]|uniref:Uncharacterized protein n=1 Tax=Helianthus annuus TaxID=4232 RepID=A0A251RQG5_HELAN|nr:hypothetical protein HanXRQr2_Chr17g0806861 [Helianthus annuus]KAJ0923265.1 hypothetical protein HanPSC8_Chr05g0213831 [Helianthus annuus]
MGNISEASGSQAGADASLKGKTLRRMSIVPDEDQASSKNRTHVKRSFRNVVSSLFYNGELKSHYVVSL